MPGRRAVLSAIGAGISSAAGCLRLAEQSDSPPAGSTGVSDTETAGQTTRRTGDPEGGAVSFEREWAIEYPADVLLTDGETAYSIGSTVASVSLDDGTVRWNRRYGWSGAAAARLTDGVLFTVQVNTGGQHAQVNANDFRETTTLWSTSGVYPSSPILALTDELVFVATSRIAGEDRGAVQALTRDDGAERWRATFETVVGSLVVHEDTLYVGGPNNAYEISDGRAIDGGYPFGEQLVVRDGQAYSVTVGGRFQAHDVATGDLIGEIRVPGTFYMKPVLFDEHVLLGGDGGLFAIDRPAQSIAFQTRTTGTVRHPPVAVGELLVFGDDEGIVYAVERKSGEIRHDERIQNLDAVQAAHDRGFVATTRSAPSQLRYYSVV